MALLPLAVGFVWFRGMAGHNRQDVERRFICGYQESGKFAIIRIDNAKSTSTFAYNYLCLLKAWAFGNAYPRMMGIPEPLIAG